jgi:hypothetical protein
MTLVGNFVQTSGQGEEAEIYYEKKRRKHGREGAARCHCNHRNWSRSLN